jgi:thiol peroxidase
MAERVGIVSMRGNPLTLVGNEVKVGDEAPDFVVLANDLSPVRFSSFRGKVCVLSSVPSLDTPVCNAQTRRLDHEAERLGTDVAILTISMDLPFAQKRWSDAARMNRVQTLSDHRDASFGTSYGLLIKEFRLLARALLLVDRDGAIRYVQIVREITDEPHYEPVLSALSELT